LKNQNTQGHIRWTRTVLQANKIVQAARPAPPEEPPFGPFLLNLFLYYKIIGKFRKFVELIYLQIHLQVDTVKNGLYASMSNTSIWWTFYVLDTKSRHLNPHQRCRFSISFLHQLNWWDSRGTMRWLRQRWIWASKKLRNCARKSKISRNLQIPAGQILTRTWHNSWLKRLLDCDQLVQSSKRYNYSSVNLNYTYRNSILNYCVKIHRGSLIELFIWVDRIQIFSNLIMTSRAFLTNLNNLIVWLRLRLQICLFRLLLWAFGHKANNLINCNKKLT
jgi:hypothetical protein